ncbi:MAG: RNA 2',3'-cyclic phosphodiesterase [Deltaproteobacteria bacterium]|nr:RNA 2',3'-cyclic phosphodiesterase [Candidatus Anaeroferrophillacea bacterium]
MTAAPEILLGDLLRRRSWWLATAESCTGGLIAHRLTNVVGSSDYFDRGVVTYSNRAKTELLGVPAELIDARGAVSPEVVGAMLDGLRGRFPVQAGIAVSGIAGPGGGSPEKPVGLVYIGVDAAGLRVVRECRFAGDREEIKSRAADRALRMLAEVLAEVPAAGRLQTGWVVRLFFAVDIPATVKQQLATAPMVLRRSAARVGSFRWVVTENLHLTIKFIGELPDEAVAGFVRRFAELCFPPFTAAIGGTGFFPSPDRPRVFWAGMAAGGRELAALAAEVENRCRAAGLAADSRSFSAHLTIARIRPRRHRMLQCCRDLQREADEWLPLDLTWQVDQLVLYSSILGPGGPVYEVVGRFPPESTVGPEELLR